MTFLKWGHTVDHFSFSLSFVFWSITYLDLVPPVLIRTLGDELSPSGTVVGSISRVIPINTQCVQILLQCVLPCPLWSSDPPPATFWSPYYGQTSWSGCDYLYYIDCWYLVFCRGCTFAALAVSLFSKCISYLIWCLTAVYSWEMFCRVI